MLQRLRMTFSRGEEVKYISHLDLMRLWERVLRRAELPLAYSQGFNPHARISLAAPLPVGVTSEAELADVFLEGRVSPYHFMKSASVQLPPGVGISTVEEVGLLWPSLQSVVRFGEYRVTVACERSREEVEEAIGKLLAAEHIPWQHRRDTGVREYDLRPLIDKLHIISFARDECLLGMRMQTGSKATGRPEQATVALGFSEYPRSIHRTRLILHAEPGLVR